MIWFLCESQVLKESFKIYCAVNDGIINLVDKVNCFTVMYKIIPEVLVLFLYVELSDSSLPCSFLRCRDMKPLKPLISIDVLVSR